MKTIAIIGDSPFVTSGLARITEAAVRGFVQDGWRVAVLCVLDEHRRDNPWGESGPVWYYPVDAGDKLGHRTTLRFLDDVNPDCILLNHDPGTCFNRIYALKNSVWGCQDQQTGGIEWMTPIVAYMPIEGLPIPKDYLAAFANVTRAATWTAWGQQELAKRGVYVDYIGLGADHADFKPLPEPHRRRLRKLFGLDKYFNIMVLSGNTRKARLAVMIHAAAILRARGVTDFSIYLHTNPLLDPRRSWSNSGPHNLYDLIEMYGAQGTEHNLIWFPPEYAGSYDRTQWDGVDYEADIDQLLEIETPSQHPEEWSKMWSTLGLTARYNCFDLFMDVNSNHGWNLPAAEAMKCGVPVAMVDDGFARTHIFRDTVFRMLPTGLDYWHTGVKLPLVSPEVVADTIEWCMRNPQELQAKARQGLTLAQTWRWEDTAQGLVRLVAAAVNEHRRARGRVELDKK